MLFSSPNAHSMSNSLTHFVSMICNRFSNLESVRPRILVIQSACTVNFFTTKLVLYAHTFPVLFSSPNAHSMSNSLTHFVSMICNRFSNLESVRPRILVIQSACTVNFFTTKLVLYAHTFPVLFSSPNAHSMSNSLTHFVSMICNRFSNLESVRPRILVIQSACTVNFFTTKLVLYAHTFPVLFSSPNAHSMSNSLTHFVSMICNRFSNLESVRPRILVIQSACTVNFFTTKLVLYAHTFPVLFSSPNVHSMSNSLTHFVSMICNRDSNLESVRPRMLVIQSACTVNFFTTL